MMNEYLAEIRFIKFYSLEKPLSKLIAGELYICVLTFISALFELRLPPVRQSNVIPENLKIVYNM